jgi:hypothetical protein
MSWSLSSFSVNARAEDMLSSIGRAVHIATRFEGKCKFVLRLVNLAEAQNQDRIATFDDLIARVPKDKLLGATLTDLLKTVPVSAEDLARLHAAREARNFLAHEAASFDIHNRPSGSIREAVAGKTSYALDHLVAHLERTRVQVRLLARGDNVISQWCFAAEELGKELPPYDLIDAYEDMVDRWVFAPVRDLLRSSAVTASD